jgi:uncharacterized cofD-like protein
VLPPLLEDDIISIIEKSNAVKLMIVNTMSQPGETDNFKVHDYLKAFEKHVSRVKLDAVLANSFKPGEKKLQAMISKGMQLTEYDRKIIADLPIRLFLRDVISMENPAFHDSEKLAKSVVEIFEQFNREQ